MTPFERCQSLISLQNARLERFDRTRTIQWNFNGIFWTGIIVATAFLYPHKDELKFGLCGLLLLGLLIFVVHFAVLRMIQFSLDYDKRKVAEYTSIIEKELGLVNLIDKKIKTEDGQVASGQKGRTKKWLIVQLMITTILIGCSIVLLTSKKIKTIKTNANTNVNCLYKCYDQ